MDDPQAGLDRLALDRRTRYPLMNVDIRMAATPICCMSFLFNSWRRSLCHISLKIT